MSRIHINVNAGITDSSSIRTETFRGHDYTVVPVIALVEGVIQGANAAQPEFAPADEFAKFPMTWNGRPVTLRHPSIGNQLVSANDPVVLEQFQIGFLANTTRDGDKLKTEAWIDQTLVEALGADAIAMMERIVEGEQFTEVSTGLFTDVVSSMGTYNSRSYYKAWQGVVPDHLAFLPDTIGACSVADGCGAPRLNSAGELVSGVLMSAPLNLGAPCCEQCTRGEPCVDKPKANEGESVPTPTDEVTTVVVDPSPEPVAAGVEDVVAEVAETEALVQAFERFTANSLPGGMTFENAREIIQTALRQEYGANDGMSDCGCYAYRYIYILGITSEMVAFERWVKGNEAYETVAVSYSIDENGGVTFTGEPVPVNLIVSIVPKPNASDASSTDVTANEGVSGANQEQEESHMTDVVSGTPATTVVTTPAASGDVTANGAGAQPVAPRTLEQHLEELPTEMREFVQEGLTLRSNQRKAMITEIVTNSGGLYTEAELENETMSALQKLQTLSKPKVDYSGQALPAGRFLPNTGESRENQNTVPVAPKAFPGRTIADVANGSAAA